MKAVKKRTCLDLDEEDGREMNKAKLEARMNKLIVEEQTVESNAIDARNILVNYRVERMKLTAILSEVLTNSNATPIRTFGHVGYVCWYCNEEYIDPADLKKHKLSFHANENISTYIKNINPSQFYVKLDITGLQCKICSDKFETLDELLQHLLEDHDRKLKMEAKKYIVPFKFDSDMLTCFMCLNKFNKFKMLLEHMHVHYRNFVCKVCDAGFVTRARLREHLKNHNTGVFSCKFCDKVFSTLLKRRSHERGVHIGTVFNKCGYCNESFKHYHQRNNHLLEVHGIAHSAIQCNACDRTFSNQKAYNIHTKRDHLMERRFKCTQCEKKFFRPQELMEHMTKHTKEKNYKCSVCLKTYSRKFTLREHMRIHENDRRFKCEQCGMAFVQKCSWRSHMRTKHGEHV